MNQELIAKLEHDACCYCAKCGKRHSSSDLNGGRCFGCGSMICAVVVAEQPTFKVKTPEDDFVMRAESLVSVKQALKKNKVHALYIVSGSPAILSYRCGSAAGSSPCDSLDRLKQQLSEWRRYGKEFSTDYDHISIEIDGVTFVADRATLKE